MGRKGTSVPNPGAVLLIAAANQFNYHHRIACGAWREL